ncbi:hypothetical protein WJX84_009362 [Apatococcus fuscideae]|uniref:Uncharacterized protein n=1 Tax=Apatococcus fuscideae TaxID=2026836 RepID=A0AAW1STX9_9CHLO
MTPHYSGTTLDAQMRYAAGTKEVLRRFLRARSSTPLMSLSLEARWLPSMMDLSRLRDAAWSSRRSGRRLASHLAQPLDQLLRTRSGLECAGHALMHIFFLPGLDVRATSTPAQILLTPSEEIR